MTRLPVIASLLICAALTVCAGNVLAEEIWLHDNTRIYGLVRGVQNDKLIVLTNDGETKTILIEEVVAIRFLSKPSLLQQSGLQEFRFVQGGRIRGKIAGNDGDEVLVETAVAGPVRINSACMRGFVALPVIGFVGRKAEELVDGDRGNASASIDLVLDRRGTLYPCVLSRFERSQLFLDYEESPIEKPIQLLYLSAVRMADAGRAEMKGAEDPVLLRVTSRDGSVIEGKVEKIHLGLWNIRPTWNPELVLPVRQEEITLVQTLGGRVQYLSQLQPASAEEKPRLTPNQPYRMDVDVQGYDLSIAGRRFPWGIGVHANSELSFELGGRFKNFICAVGIATRMGKRGSVVFEVLGDGKQLFQSKTVHGGADALPVDVKVEGVKKLVLRVNDAGDLDLGDAAIWGGARVVR